MVLLVTHSGPYINYALKLVNVQLKMWIYNLLLWISKSIQVWFRYNNGSCFMSRSLQFIADSGTKKIFKLQFWTKYSTQIDSLGQNRSSRWNFNG